MGVPGMSRLGRNMGEPGAGRRIRNADEVLAGRALNLPAGEMDLALERLVTVGTVELEFGGVHSRFLIKRKARAKSLSKF